MRRKKTKHSMPLAEKFPPSESCSCEICSSYCIRPGWWTLEEAAKAIDAGYGPRMMLEMSPDLSFGVLSPAFKGCESSFALNQFADYGCNFHSEAGCELHGTGLMPLECRFCHHDRPGMGPKCHTEIEREWDTPAGKALVGRWGKITGFWDHLEKVRSGETEKL